MLLTVEYDPAQEEVDIVCDIAGLDLLMDRLAKLRISGGHSHLMTSSWAGNELTEDRQTENGVLINHVRIVLTRDV